MSAPVGFRTDNLLGNICEVIADRHGLSPEDVARRIADEWGGGDYGSAEDLLWNDRIGPMIDLIVADLLVGEAEKDRA
jgi:hypothetical protein